MGSIDARNKALEMVLPSKKPAASDQSSPSSPTKPEPEPEPEPTTPTTTPTTTSKMLDCDAPASPKNGDPFGKICVRKVRGDYFRCWSVFTGGHYPSWSIGV